MMKAKSIFLYKSSFFVGKVNQPYSYFQKKDSFKKLLFHCSQIQCARFAASVAASEINVAVATITETVGAIVVITAAAGMIAITTSAGMIGIIGRITAAVVIEKTIFNNITTAALRISVLLPIHPYHLIIVTTTATDDITAASNNSKPATTSHEMTIESAREDELAAAETGKKTMLLLSEGDAAITADVAVTT